MIGKMNMLILLYGFAYKMINDIVVSEKNYWVYRMLVILF